MRTSLLTLLLLATTAVSASAGGGPASPNVIDPGVPGRVRVKVSRAIFASGVTAGSFGEATRRFGISRVTPWLDPKLLAYRITTYKRSSGGSWEAPERSLMRIMEIEYSAATAPEEVAAALSAVPGVEYAEPIHRARLFGNAAFTPNDPELGRLWHLNAIKARDAWDIVRGDSTMIVAEVDAGITRDHEDLAAAMWHNAGESGVDGGGHDKRTNGIDDDGNGLVDDYWGWDFSGSTGYTPDNDPNAESDSHGTHVAGIIGAVGNNGIGVVGVAFGVKVMGVKIGDFDLPATLFHEYNGIVYAAQMGAKVINCSWGNRSFSRAEKEVIDWLGTRKVLLVAAAGNDGNDTEFYPASYPGVLSVSSVDKEDRRSSFSNANGKVGISAPGNAIYSTVFNGAYEEDSGTSMATPIVSGAAALVAQKYPNLDAEQIAEVLRASSDDISGSLGADADYMGAGRLNLLRAVQTGPTLRSARMVDYHVVDANGDGVLLGGETVRIALDVKNILAQSSQVHLSMSATSPASITIANGDVDLGTMAAGQVITSPDGSMTFTLPESLPNDAVVVLRVAVSTDDRTNLGFIRLQVNPSYLTTDLNRIQATFNSVGNIGYNGTNTRQGLGFKFDTTHSLLYHGGLMIGTSDQRWADVVRINSQTGAPTGDGFRTIRPYRITTSADSNVQIGTARFDDSPVPSGSRMGVDVEMTTWEYRALGLDNSVIVAYTISNTGSTTLNGLHCGLFLDWDVDIVETENKIAYDPTTRLGYARNAFNDHSTVVGAGLLTDQAIDFYALDNDDIVHGIGDFSSARKWSMLTGGVQRPVSSVADVSMIIGGGPVDIPPGGKATFAFALSAAWDLASLRSGMTSARERYLQSASVVVEDASVGGVSVHPTPFADHALLELTMKAPGAVTLRLFDASGRQVATSFEGVLAEGRQAIPIDGSGLAGGLYIYELRTPTGVTHGRLVKLAK